jgi:hypothetical protein
MSGGLASVEVTFGDSVAEIPGSVLAGCSGPALFAGGSGGTGCTRVFMLVCWFWGFLKLAESVGNAPTSADADPVSRPAQPACICLPSKTG